MGGPLMARFEIARKTLLADPMPRLDVRSDDLPTPRAQASCCRGRHESPDAACATGHKLGQLIAGVTNIFGALDENNPHTNHEREWTQGLPIWLSKTNNARLAHDRLATQMIRRHRHLSFSANGRPQAKDGP